MIVELKNLIQRIFLTTGYELRKREVVSEYCYVPRYLCPSAHKLIDFRQETDFLEIAKEIKAQGQTHLDYNRLFVLWHAVKNTYMLNQSIAEVGVWRGGSTKFLATALARFNNYQPLHAFDTFEGMPETVDKSKDGNCYLGQHDDVSLEAVKEYLSPFKNIAIHVGKFEDTSAELSPSTIFSLVHLDVDIYASTVNCLEYFWPRLAGYGTIVLDDYGFTTCPGVKLAVEQFLSQVESVQTWYMISTGQFVIQKMGS